MRLHTIKRSLLIGILLFMFSDGLQAQENVTEKTRIGQLFGKNFRVPHGPDCQSFYGTVMLSYSSQSATPVITFSYNWKEPWIKSFNKVMPHFTSAKWKDIFPAIGSDSNFNILLPLMVSTMDDCEEKIPAYEVLAMMEKSISIPGNKPVFIFTPLVVNVWKPVR